MTRRTTKKSTAPKSPAAQAVQQISADLVSDGSMVFVPFSKFLPRGQTLLEGVTLRKPGAPELRGLQMMSLIQMDVVQLETLLPRISMPPLHKGDFAPGPDSIEISDLFAMGAEVANFLLSPPKSSGSPAT